MIIFVGKGRVRWRDGKYFCIKVSMACTYDSCVRWANTWTAFQVRERAPMRAREAFTLCSGSMLYDRLLSLRIISKRDHNSALSIHDCGAAVLSRWIGGFVEQVCGYGGVQ